MTHQTIDQELKRKREAYSSDATTDDDTHLGENMKEYHQLNRAREEKIFLEVSFS